MNKASNLIIKDLKKFGFNTENRTYIVAEIVSIIEVMLMLQKD